MILDCSSYNLERTSELLNSLKYVWFDNQPNIIRQKQYKLYIEELDRRRGTDYKKLFPIIADWIQQID